MVDLILSGYPNPRQEEFFLATQRHIGYGGARGGGKSWAMRRKFVLLALKYPGLKLLLLRRTLPELRENHILPLQAELIGIVRYKADEKAFIFPNGSRIKLGYCATEKDIYQYQGQEYDVIGLEEATHFTESQKDFLTTCNRSTRTDFKPRMYYSGNPGNVGHKWFKRLFIDKNYKGKEKSEDYIFIPAKVYDNEVLMSTNPEYVEALENLPDTLRKAHLDGDWDIFAGQAFSEWRNDITHYEDMINTHVIKSFKIPDTWKRYRTFDFGYAKPFAVQWWAVDYDGRAYLYRQLYGCTGEPNVGVKWHPTQIAQEIKKIEDKYESGNHIIGIADPSIWDSSRGESIAEQMEKERVYFSKGDNKRLPGKMQFHYRLAFDDEGLPMMYVFDTCKDFIRTIPELIYDDKDVEDIDTDGEDHDYDAARYFFMSNPIAPRKSIKNNKPKFNPLESEQPKDRYGFMRM